MNTMYDNQYMAVKPKMSCLHRYCSGNIAIKHQSLVVLIRMLFCSRTSLKAKAKASYVFSVFTSVGKASDV